MKRIAYTLAAVASVLTLAAAASAQQQLKSPDDVKTALKLLVQVSNDFKRQITNKNFTRVKFLLVICRLKSLDTCTSSFSAVFTSSGDFNCCCADAAAASVSTD